MDGGDGRVSATCWLAQEVGGRGVGGGWGNTDKWQLKKRVELWSCSFFSISYCMYNDMTGLEGTINCTDKAENR